MARTNSFYLAEGQTLAQAIGFNAASMRVDNPTNGWVTVDGDYQAGPLSFGYVQVLKPASIQARVVCTLTSPGGVVATGNGQAARITFFDEEQAPAPGSYQTISASVTLGAAIQQQVRSGAGVTTDVGYRAADLTMPVQLIGGTAGNTAALLGQAAMAASLPVVIASNQSNLPIMGPAPTNATSVALAASQVLKGAAGRLWGVSGFNTNVALQYIQLHNAAALPANGTVPVVVIPVAGGSTFSIDYGVYGRQFTTGIVVANSTTLATLTTGAADCWFDGQVT